MSESKEMELFSPDQWESGLLLPDHVVRKVYTAKQMQHRESMKSMICMAVAAGFGADFVAAKAGVSSRTVREVAAQNMAEVAGDRKVYAGELWKTAGRFIGLAQTKADQATFKDLMVGFGIVSDKADAASNSLAMGLGSEDPEQRLEPDGAVAARVLAWIGGKSGVIDVPSDSVADDVCCASSTCAELVSYCDNELGEQPSAGLAQSGQERREGGGCDAAAGRVVGMQLSTRHAQDKDAPSAVLHSDHHPATSSVEKHAGAPEALQDDAKNSAHE